MLNALVRVSIHWRNQFPLRTGVSQAISPSTIVEGKDKPDLGIKKIAYGAYALAHIETTNTIKARSIPAIALYPGDNGDYYFMSLWSGRRIHTKIWEELPIDDEAIELVHKLAQEQEQPVMRDGYPLFEWSPGVNVDDPEEDYDNFDKDEEPDETDLQTQTLHLSDDDEMDQLQDGGNYEFEEQIQERADKEETPIMKNNKPQMAQDLVMLDAEPTEPIIVEDVTDEDDEDSAEAEKRNESTAEAEETNNDTAEEENVGLQDAEDPSRRYPLQANRNAEVERLSPNQKGKTHNSAIKHQFTMSRPSIVNRVSRKRQFGQMRKKTQSIKKGLMHRAMHVLLTQMTVSKGIELFGERAVAALIKEFKQLVDGAMEGKPVIAPIDPSQITPEMKKKALRATNLIKEKGQKKLKEDAALMAANSINTWCQTKLCRHQHYR